jgi:hypothetical protein
VQCTLAIGHEVERRIFKEGAMSTVDPEKTMTSLSELLEKWNHAKGTDREALMDRIKAVSDDLSRAAGLSEAVIAETNRQGAEAVAARIRREVENGVQLYRRALLGDTVAIKKLLGKEGRIAFATAIAEGAISEDDLTTLPASVRSALENSALH